MNQQRGDHVYCMTNESPNIASFAAYIPKCLLYPLVISYMDNGPFRSNIYQWIRVIFHSYVELPEGVYIYILWYIYILYIITIINYIHLNIYIYIYIICVNLTGVFCQWFGLQALKTSVEKRQELDDAIDQCEQDRGLGWWQWWQWWQWSDDKIWWVENFDLSSVYTKIKFCYVWFVPIVGLIPLFFADEIMIYSSFTGHITCHISI